ncbi:tRNA pseudouridine(55) synthase TruB [Thermithiobacillus tepidarius DSM 3134]|uniref:tRNA pseudouridine(55) synthase TruB n=1 Tax=Thermithiobacillus tepidarius TaxID=929 RepID=UPI00040C229D|nr:tRNA pseudouridine(55) synthase TruB [Thermithiobacillus tepidarius]
MSPCTDGILLLDKPEGVSSNAALQQAKRLLRLKKAGHTGSLDPLATGLLPLCFGEATKFSQFLLDADKVYRARFRLGSTTTTGDAEGEVLERRPVRVDAAQVEHALAAFRGEILQVPPMYSALKQQGRPLYEIARQGGTVERAPRRVQISRYELLALHGDELEVEVACSKGTYIRSLAVDLGEALGCGAHVSALRRLASGPFRIEQALTLETLAAELERGACPLLPADQALGHLPAAALGDSSAAYLLLGQAVTAPRGLPSGLVRLYGPGGRFLGLGAVLDDGRVAPRRLISTNQRL